MNTLEALGAETTMRTRSMTARTKILFLAAAVAVMAAPATFADTPIWSVSSGSPTLAADTPIWSIFGPIVRVTVFNSGGVARTGVVAVAAVVNGTQMTSAAPFQCGARSSTVVSVPFGGPVTSMTSVTIADEGSPF